MHRWILPPIETTMTKVVRIDPIDAWSELRFDVVVGVAVCYALLSTLILCPPNFREMLIRFKEFKRGFG